MSVVMGGLTRTISKSTPRIIARREKTPWWQSDNVLYWKVH